MHSFNLNVSLTKRYKTITSTKWCTKPRSMSHLLIGNEIDIAFLETVSVWFFVS